MIKEKLLELGLSNSNVKFWFPCEYPADTWLHDGDRCELYGDAGVRGRTAFVHGANSLVVIHRAKGGMCVMCGDGRMW